MKMHKCKWNDPLCLKKPRLFGCICGKGGSQTTVYQPTPPEQPSQAQSINEWAQAMPAVYDLQAQYAPQEAQQQLDLLQQYGQPMAQAYADAQKSLNPETSALQEKMAGQASAGMEAEVPQWAQDKYRSDMAANLGTNVGSGIGADYMSKGMMQQQTDYQNYYRNLGLSLAQRQPLAQPSQPQTSNYMQSFNPQTALGYSSSNYGNFAQASKPMALTNQRDTGFLGWWGGY